MKLWVEGENGGPGKAVRAAVKEQVNFINRKAVSRAKLAVQAIRSAELNVLKGQRSGRVYRVPGTKSSYRASAPGEAPARRTGNLRMHWTGQVLPVYKPGGVEIIAQLESQEKYAYYLENGKGMTPRPFVERIKEKAAPEIRKIYSEPYR